MRKALFAGFFDPPTLGHLDIIEKAGLLCDKLLLCVAQNPWKAPAALFKEEEREELLRKMTAHLPYVEVTRTSGLVAKFAQEKHVNFLIRGMRSERDFMYEMEMAAVNHSLGDIETVFLLPKKEHLHISSTLVRQRLEKGEILSDLLPPSIINLLA